MDFDRKPEVTHIEDDRAQPLIIGFVADLMFSTRIETTASRMGFRVEWVESGQQVERSDSIEPIPGLSGRLWGPDAAIVDYLSLRRPALLIFDLGNPGIPWRDWIPRLKTDPATQRLPVVAYSAHVEVDVIKEARSRGADTVLARSRFISDLPHILQKYARLPDPEAIKTACEDRLSPLALKGLREFNQGQYFEAHESLEEAWNEDEGPGRDLYRAILQVAVAYLQIERGNFNGAEKMFLRLRQWLDPLPDRCRGVDVKTLKDSASAVHSALRSLGPSRISLIDRSLMQPVRYQEPV